MSTITDLTKYLYKAMYKGVRRYIEVIKWLSLEVIEILRLCYVSIKIRQNAKHSTKFYKDNKLLHNNSNNK